MAVIIGRMGWGDRPTELGDWMDERRIELRMSWQDVADESTMSRSAIDLIRRGKSRPYPQTRVALERALQWKRGSIDAILRLDEPTPLEQSEPTADDVEVEIADLRRQLDRVQAQVKPGADLKQVLRELIELRRIVENLQARPAGTGHEEGTTARGA